MTTQGPTPRNAELAPPPAWRFVLLNLCPEGAKIAGEDVATRLPDIVDALNWQCEQISEVYGELAHVRLGASPKDREPGEIAMNVRPTIQDLAKDAVAFHQVTDGVPDIEEGIDDNLTVSTGNESLSQSLSHEMAETLVDAGANGWKTTAEGNQQAAEEVADPVQNTFYAAPNGVDLSNWMYPAAWIPGAPGPFDHLGMMESAEDISYGYVIEATSPTDVSDVSGGEKVLARTVRASDGRMVRVRGELTEKQLRKKSHPWSRTSRRGVNLAAGLAFNELAIRLQLRGLQREELAQQVQSLEKNLADGRVTEDTYGRLRQIIQQELVYRREALAAAARPPTPDNVPTPAPALPTKSSAEPEPGPSWTPAELADLTRDQVQRNLDALEARKSAGTISMRDYSRARIIMQQELAKRPLEALRRAAIAKSAQAAAVASAPAREPAPLPSAPRRATADPNAARPSAPTTTRPRPAPPAAAAPPPPRANTTTPLQQQRSTRGASSSHGQQRQAQSAPSHRTAPSARSGGPATGGQRHQASPTAPGRAQPPSRSTNRVPVGRSGGQAPPPGRGPSAARRR